jgi:hypothetical protein
LQPRDQGEGTLSGMICETHLSIYLLELLNTGFLLGVEGAEQRLEVLAEPHGQHHSDLFLLRLHAQNLLLEGSDLLELMRGRRFWRERRVLRRRGLRR